MVQDVSPGRQGEIPPVLMFGFERSGTTLLSMMVGAHPDIAVPLSTAGMWYRLMKKVERHPQPSREWLADQLLAEERIRLWDAPLDRAGILSRMEAASISHAFAALHMVYASCKGKRHWASMDIAHMDNLGLLNSWFPDAKFLHIVRDPRDVAVSFKGYRYGSANVLEVTQKWSHAVECSLREGAILGKDSYRLVRYEDIILEPELTLAGICDFIGVAYSPLMLDYRSMVEAKIPGDKRDLWPALGQLPQKDKVGRWRSEMSRAEQLIVEDHAKGLLSRLGYETTQSGSRPIQSFLVEFWHFANRGNRIGRMVKRKP